MHTVVIGLNGGVTEPVFATVAVAGLELRTATWGLGHPDIVMLHDGLGSIPQWRSVPEEVGGRTNRTIMAYERAGHGESLPQPTGPWPTDWLHREAHVLQNLLAVVGAARPILVGHSDGGSTALLHAAMYPTASSGVVALAAHSWVEQICFDSIVDMRMNRRRIEAGLARSHDNPEALFEAWSGVWISDAFRTWDIRPELAAVEVPTLIAQGSDDAHASEEHAHSTAAAIGNNAASRIVPAVGHIMHHDDAEVVVDLISEFVESLS